MRYVEGIFTSVCTSLCVRSFSAILGLENRLVNKEIIRIMGHHFGFFYRLNYRIQGKFSRYIHWGGSVAR